MVRHLVTLEIGAGEDLVSAAAEIIELEDARSSIVLKLEGAGGGQRGEGEKRDKAAEKGGRMHFQGSFVW